MNTESIPSIRVEPGLREQREGLLLDGETVSQFVEASVRESVRRRLNQAEFLKDAGRSLAVEAATVNWLPCKFQPNVSQSD